MGRRLAAMAGARVWGALLRQGLTVAGVLKAVGGTAPSRTHSAPEAALGGTGEVAEHHLTQGPGEMAPTLSPQRTDQRVKLTRGMSGMPVVRSFTHDATLGR